MQLHSDLAGGEQLQLKQLKKQVLALAQSQEP